LFTAAGQLGRSESGFNLLICFITNLCMKKFDCAYLYGEMSHSDDVQNNLDGFVKEIVCG